ncbi:MAG: DUF1638 domain-containing protein [Lachnospiraceae bacterium]|nr:DUF1638 domain-containing protein [Lachnospiraceae bacterium]
MDAVILACSSLNSHVDAAQEKMGTAYPVIYVDRKYHEDPKQMRQHIMDELKYLPSEADTVLVAMGFCGGSWKAVSFEKRIVIPRVDDCITLLLHTDDTWHADLKKKGHLYLRDTDTEEYSLEAMQRKLCRQYGGMYGSMIFNSMFTNYTNVDMIDTGVYDCYSEEYVIQAQRNADLIRGVLDYVAGSNLILEKLVSGQWDQQFIVAEPGQVLSEKDFWEERSQNYF